MKKVFTFALLLAAFGLFAQGKTILFQNSFEKMDGWFKNSACNRFDGGGTFSFVPGGKKGNCLKIVTNAKQLFMLNKSKSVPVENGAKLKVIFTMKGKGTISLIPMAKNAKGKMIYLSGGNETINSDTWEEIPFIIQIAQKGETLKDVTFRVNFAKNSTLFVDGVRMEKMK